MTTNPISKNSNSLDWASRVRTNYKRPAAEAWEIEDRCFLDSQALHDYARSTPIQEKGMKFEYSYRDDQRATSSQPGAGLIAGGVLAMGPAMLLSAVGLPAAAPVLMAAGPLIGFGLSAYQGLFRGMNVEDYGKVNGVIKKVEEEVLVLPDSPYPDMEGGSEPAPVFLSQYAKAPVIAEEPGFRGDSEQWWSSAATDKASHLCDPLIRLPK